MEQQQQQRKKKYQRQTRKTNYLNNETHHQLGNQKRIITLPLNFLGNQRTYISPQLNPVYPHQFHWMANVVGTVRKKIIIIIIAFHRDNVGGVAAQRDVRWERVYSL